MPILSDIGLLARCLDEGAQSDIHLLKDAVVAFDEDGIQWVGAEADLPGAYTDEARISAGGMTVVPGLVDCHTHLAFGGWRADEFEQRILGESYQEVAARGGGIRKSVRQTRAATEDLLVQHCLAHLDAMAALGVTTVECKSGYGLSLEDELKTLRAYRRADAEHPISLVSTLLGAHVVPDPENCNMACYISMLTNELIPAAARQGLAEFNDVFVEDGAFPVDAARRILKTGIEYGLRSKLHVDQLTDGGGAALAASLGAVSADHLEYTGAEGMAAMAEAGVVAVSLPFATLYLNQKPMDARAFIAAGAAVAVATDFNPGSAPSYDLPLAMMLACTMNRMTPAEALKGATLYAARAVGREHDRGSIVVGKRADFTVLDVPSIEHWLYHFRPNQCRQTWIGGRRIV